jgi:hypothetical protein
MAAPLVFGRTTTPEMLASILDGCDGLGDIDAQRWNKRIINHKAAEPFSSRRMNRHVAPPWLKYRSALDMC